MDGRDEQRVVARGHEVRLQVIDERPTKGVATHSGEARLEFASADRRIIEEGANDMARGREGIGSMHSECYRGFRQLAAGGWLIRPVDDALLVVPHDDDGASVHDVEVRQLAVARRAAIGQHERFDGVILHDALTLPDPVGILRGWRDR